MAQGRSEGRFKSITRIAVLIVALAALSGGCATLPPAGCENSLLWKSGAGPSITSGVAIIATTEALQKYPQVKPLIVEGIKQAMNLLDNEQASYADVALLMAYYVQRVNTQYGVRLVGYTVLFTDLDKPLPIDKCDRDLLRAHFRKQLALLQ